VRPLQLLEGHRRGPGRMRGPASLQLLKQCRPVAPQEGHEGLRGPTKALKAPWTVMGFWAWPSQHVTVAVGLAASGRARLRVLRPILYLPAAASCGDWPCRRGPCPLLHGQDVAGPCWAHGWPQLPTRLHASLESITEGTHEDWSRCAGVDEVMSLMKRLHWRSLSMCTCVVIFRCKKGMARQNMHAWGHAGLV
jgi:hypothetical protein